MSKFTIVQNFTLLFALIDRVCLARYISGVTHKVRMIRVRDIRSGAMLKLRGLSHISGLIMDKDTIIMVLIIIEFILHDRVLIVSRSAIGIIIFSIYL